MIAFTSAITEPEAYRRYAEPGIRAVAEADSDVQAYAAAGSVPRSYNLLLDAAASREDLEALVIVHPYAEIADPEFCRKLRQALSDPDVGVVGCVGATGVRSIAWWEGAVSAAPIVHRYVERGGGDLPGFAWARPERPCGDVETVAGFLLALSPWAVRTVRFDESLRLNYGFDVDYCLRVRGAGRRIVAADLRMIYHHSLDLVGDLDMWIEAHIRFAEKHDPGESDEAAWTRRARRAEAEREAARAIGYSNMLVADARVAGLERALAAATGSASWRATAPLRRVNRLRADAAERLRRRR